MQRGTRSYCLLRSLSSQTSHLCSGLAAGEELQPGGHAWERRSGEEIQKGRSWLRRASSDCVANAMAFKMLKEGQLVLSWYGYGYSASTGMGTQPPLPLLQMHILASLLPRVTKLEMMGHGAERTCLCPSGVTNSDLLAQVGLCESFPKTAKPHLILPLPFLIAPIPFHAALEMPSINPGQLLQQEL